MNPKPELLKRILGGIFWYPMPFVALAAYFEYITWSTFRWYLVGDAIYLILLGFIAICIEFAIRRSFKSSKTGLYSKLMFRCFQWKLLNLVAPQQGDLIAYPFMVFVSLELPAVFKAGGMEAVWLRISGWGDEYKLKMNRAFDEIVARKKRQIELDAMTPEQRQEELMKMMQRENQIRQLYSKAQHWGDEEFKLKLDEIFEGSNEVYFEEKMELASDLLKEAEERWKPKMEARKQAALEAVAKLNAKAKA